MQAAGRLNTMGTYYNPVSDVEEGIVGRQIVTHSSGNHQAAISQLKPGEHLYALCDRLIFKQVVCVDEKREFDHFYEQYNGGMLISFQLVALTDEQHAKAA